VNTSYKQRQAKRYQAVYEYTNVALSAD